MFEAAGTMCTKRRKEAGPAQELRAVGQAERGCKGDFYPWTGKDPRGIQEEAGAGSGRDRGMKAAPELVLPEPVGVSHPPWSLREPALGPLPVPAPSGCPQPGASP